MSKAKKEIENFYDDIGQVPQNILILCDGESYDLPNCIPIGDLQHVKSVLSQYGKSVFEGDFPRDDLGFSFEIKSPVALWNLTNLGWVSNNFKKMHGLPMHRYRGR